MPSLTDQAYKKAQEVLGKCTTPYGFKASVAKMRDYSHVWARDAVITTLGALFVPQKIIQRAVKQSFETLRKYQTPLGMIPNNVDEKNKRANFHAVFDAASWYIIGLAARQRKDPDTERIRDFFPSVEKALLWLSYQDTDANGLIEMREAADWEDMFVVREAGLTINVLYAQALKDAAAMAALLKEKEKAARYRKQAAYVKGHINDNFWIQQDSDALDEDLVRQIGSEWQASQIEALIRLRDPHYYLPYLAFHDAGLWCDALGNLLAVLFGIADARKSRMILTYMKKHTMDYPYPVKAIYPPIYPGDKDWRQYYYKHLLNIPHQYHNGGIWPFIGGLYVAALVKTKELHEAKAVLEKLAEANKLGAEGEWEFNEWLHGATGQPNGVPQQAWSAAMYIYAYEAVKRGKVPFF